MNEELISKLIEKIGRDGLSFLYKNGVENYQNRDYWLEYIMEESHPNVRTLRFEEVVEIGKKLF